MVNSARLLGLRAYSRHRGCSLMAVQEAIKAGRISVEIVDGKKKIDPVKADAEWRKNTPVDRNHEFNPKMQKKKKASSPDPEKLFAELFPEHSREINNESPTSLSGEIEKVEAAIADPAENYRKNRAKKEEFQAKMVQLNYEREAGNLVDAKAVRRQAFETARRVRDAIMQIPDRISAELAAEVDPRDIENILLREFTTALDELSKEFIEKSGPKRGRPKKGVSA